MRLDRGQMHDVLADEVIGDADAFRVDVIERQHFGVGPIGNPLHLGGAEVKEGRDLIVLKDGHVTVQVFAFEGIPKDRLILHTNQIVEARLPERQNRAFQLPGRGIGRGHGKCHEILSFRIVVV